MAYRHRRRQVRGGEQFGKSSASQASSGGRGTEAGLHVEGPDDRDELQVQRPRRANSKSISALTCRADQDVTQVEVPVQQDVIPVVGQVPEVRQAPGCGVEHAVVGERELPGHRDQPEGR